jgi:hypothetical protein
MVDYCVFCKKEVMTGIDPSIFFKTMGTYAHIECYELMKEVKLQ